MTEYHSAPQRDFKGKKVLAPGLNRKLPVDFLYGARGVSMQGDGELKDGSHIHLCAGFGIGWLTGKARRTSAARGFPQGPPAWRHISYWKNAKQHLTFPLARGGWSNGRGKFYPGKQGSRFCPGSSRPLHPYRTVAVDPELIPLGSPLYLETYRALGLGDGCMLASDTGGAIRGRHIDVFRPAPGRGEQARRLERVPLRVAAPGQPCPRPPVSPSP